MRSAAILSTIDFIRGTCAVGFSGLSGGRRAVLPPRGRSARPAPVHRLAGALTAAPRPDRSSRAAARADGPSEMDRPLGVEEAHGSMTAPAAANAEVRSGGANRGAGRQPHGSPQPSGLPARVLPVGTPGGLRLVGFCLPGCRKPTRSLVGQWIIRGFVHLPAGLGPSLRRSIARHRSVAVEDTYLFDSNHIISPGQRSSTMENALEPKGLFGGSQGYLHRLFHRYCGKCRGSPSRQGVSPRKP